MNPSYGDSTNAAHGRARTPGQGGGYDTYGDPGPRAGTGRATVGRAASGSASVPRSPVPADQWQGGGGSGRATVPSASGYGDDYGTGSGGRGGAASGSARPGGARHGGQGRASARASASVGSASVGSASVGAAAGRASAGRASVGAVGFDGSPAGRATVGRAVVAPDGAPGAPGAPGGPTRPGLGRRASGGGGRKKLGRRAKLRNLILAAVALFIIISGGVVVVGTYYFDSVKMPDALPVPAQSTTIYYSDGKTVMAKIGDQNRTLVGSDQIPDYVKKAVVATEDNTFYTNAGVDYKGILRALVNNASGGDRQGASTITQQYARKMADLEGISYARKLREAVIAMKLTKNYSKDAILTAYLNTVYFGRGAYGIEAAAQAYFHKDVKQLTVEEGMVLAGTIKQPEPDPDDPKGSPGYDPAYGLQQSKDRWQNYILPNMVKLGFLPADKAATMKYPTDWVKPSANDTSGQYGMDQPTGVIVHHVMDELSHQKDVPALASTKALKTGGYKIVTTIDYNMEQQAINYASIKGKDSVLKGQPSNLQAGLVTIKPGTGQVLAYYGGDSGAGYDYAGMYSDPVLDTGQPSGLNFSPGSTFKLYTLATALSQGISVDSYWSGPPTKTFPEAGRTDKNPVRNADGEADSCPKNTYPEQYVCTLQLGLQDSMNTVYFGVGVKVGPANIIDMAKAMGIQHLWTDSKQRLDLANYTGAQLFPSKLGYEVSIGQYGTTVLDNATGVATIAARGIEAQPHFVSKVYQGNNLVYKEAFRQTDVTKTTKLTRQELDDETWAMETVNQHGASKNRLAGGRQAAAKTGTWQLSDTSNEDRDAWYAGFTAQYATVVHISSKDPKDMKIRYTDSAGSHIMSGTNLPGTIWKKYMDAISQGLPKVKLPEPKHVGDATAGNAPTPEQAPPAQNQPGPGDPGNGNGNGNQPCLIPAFCQKQGGGGGGGN